MFASVCEEAADPSSLQEFAQQRRSQHLVDFFDLNISEVVFLCEAECTPVVVVLKNMSDGERGIRSRMQEEKCDDIYFG